MDIKSTLLLATALFLISAPQPDSRTIAEMTGNFIVPTDERALLAAEAGKGERETREQLAPKTDEQKQQQPEKPAPAS